MLASAFPGLGPELQGPEDVGRQVKPAPPEEEIDHRQALLPRRSYEGDEMTEMSESTKALSSTYPAVPFNLFISNSFMLC